MPERPAIRWIHAIGSATCVVLMTAACGSSSDGSETSTPVLTASTSAEAPTSVAPQEETTSPETVDDPVTSATPNDVPDSSDAQQDDTTSAAGDERSWVQGAESACAAAIDRYQAGKAKNDSPDARAGLAALAVNAASTGALARTPPTALTRTMANQLNALASEQANMAQAVHVGGDELAALDRVQAAGQALRGTANRLGASTCARMTTEV